MDVFHFIGSVLFGGFFIIQGVSHFTKHAMITSYAASKGVVAPGAVVTLSGLLIVLGGLGVIFGVTRFGLFLITLFLVPVTLQMHAFWKVSDPAARSRDMIDFLKNTALLGASLMLL